MFILSGCVPEKLNIVVTNYPTQFLVEKLAGDTVNVTRLDTGTVAQRAQINSNYEEILEQGDVIFFISELQPYFELYLDDFKEVDIEMVDLALGSSLYDFKRYTSVVLNNQIHTVEDEYYDTDLVTSVDTYDKDPMLWMDSIAMTSMARTILNWLVENFPDEATTFNRNFSDLEVELTRLYAQFQSLRSSDLGISFVSITPSFGNWQKSYNVSVYPVVMSKYGVLPSEELLNAIRERIIADGVRYIAFEENMPTEYLLLFNQLKTELDLIQINLSNLFYLDESDVDENTDYISKMYQNLETLEAIASEEGS